MPRRERIYLDGSETKEELMSRGLSQPTAWRSMQRGWYVPNYFDKQIAVDGENDDIFDDIINISAFSRHCVVKALNRMPELREFYWEEIPDLAQDGLVKAWETRDRSHSSFKGWVAKIIIYEVYKAIRKDKNHRRLLIKHLYPNLVEEK